jgi:hypothetical protein
MAVNALGLDPEDPLIPLPWQMDRIRAYRASKALAAEEEALKMQNRMLDIEKKLSERPESKINKAAELYQAMEQLRQKQEGIPFEDVAKKSAIEDNLNLLEASKRQGLYNIEQAGLKGKMAGIQAQLMGEKGLAPTATVSIGGVKQQALPEQVGQTSADIYQQIFQNQVPQLTKAYIAQGYDPDSAVKMAGADVTKNLFKAQSSGKVVLTSKDGMSTISYTNEQAQKMWKDPSTPAFLKAQLNNFFGESEQPKAQSWIQTRLGK